ncbi:MAG: hypothetical protein LBT53_08060 [Puniceicoccales bacterium]|nr:hypothetical protein [Puniceicoccales bacterium]
MSLWCLWTCQFSKPSFKLPIKHNLAWLAWRFAVKSRLNAFRHKPALEVLNGSQGDAQRDGDIGDFLRGAMFSHVAQEQCACVNKLCRVWFSLAGQGSERVTLSLS